MGRMNIPIDSLEETVVHPTVKHGTETLLNALGCSNVDLSLYIDEQPDQVDLKDSDGKDKCIGITKYSFQDHVPMDPYQTSTDEDSVILKDDKAGILLTPFYVPMVIETDCTYYSTSKTTLENMRTRFLAEKIKVALLRPIRHNIDYIIPKNVTDFISKEIVSIKNKINIETITVDDYLKDKVKDFGHSANFSNNEKVNVSSFYIQRPQSYTVLCENDLQIDINSEKNLYSLNLNFKIRVYVIRSLIFLFNDIIYNRLIDEKYTDTDYLINNNRNSTYEKTSFSEEVLNKNTITIKNVIMGSPYDFLDPYVNRNHFFRLYFAPTVVDETTLIINIKEDVRIKFKPLIYKWFLEYKDKLFKDTEFLFTISVYEDYKRLPADNLEMDTSFNIEFKNYKPDLNKNYTFHIETISSAKLLKDKGFVQRLYDKDPIESDEVFKYFLNREASSTEVDEVTLNHIIDEITEIEI